MPKIHKSKFRIRPIIASINHPTPLLSFVIDLIFQPLVIKNETYLKDSHNLIQICDICTGANVAHRLQILPLYSRDQFG